MRRVRRFSSIRPTAPCRAFLTPRNTHVSFLSHSSLRESVVTTPATAEVRKTALNLTHRRMGAKMVNFGGWDMPVEYSGIISEHVATRTAAGLFDVSHMGEIELRGPQALDLVQKVTCNNAAKLAKDWEHIRRHNTFGVEVENAGVRYTQLAIQGPKALGILQPSTTVPL